MSTSPRVEVIGLGCVYRADDGVGPAVLHGLHLLLPGGSPGLRITACPGDSAGLIGLWENARLAVVVDACLTRPGQAGVIARTELAVEGRLRAAPGPRHSTHGLGLKEAWELSRVLDRCPARLVLYTVGVTDVSRSHGLTAPVAAAVPQVAEGVIRDVRDARADGM